MGYFRLWRDRSDQRVVEYPFLFDNLPHLHTLGLNPQPRILDVGCCESDLPLELALLGKYEVYAIDIRRYKTDGLPVHFIRADVRTPIFPPEFFDIILAISTIEHVGLNWYDNKWLDPDGDIAAMREIRRILKPEGIAIVTVDAGKAGEHWFRVYTQDNLHRLTQNWKVVKMKWFEKVTWMKDGWIECSAEKASSRESKEYAEACVCMVLRRD